MIVPTNTMPTPSKSLTLPTVVLPTVVIVVEAEAEPEPELEPEEEMGAATEAEVEVEMAAEVAMDRCRPPSRSWGPSSLFCWSCSSPLGWSLHHGEARGKGSGTLGGVSHGVKKH